MTVARVNRAVEAGTLDPVAKKIAVSFAKGTLWADFFGGSIWGLIGELIRDEVTREREKELVVHLRAYLDVCQFLQIEDPGIKGAEICLRILGREGLEGDEILGEYIRGYGEDEGEGPGKSRRADFAVFRGSGEEARGFRSNRCGSCHDDREASHHSTDAERPAS